MTASVNNYSVLKGIVYFTPTGGSERDMGNCSSFTFTPTVEKLDHFSSRAGIKSKDKSVIVSQSGEISMTLDEFTLDNLQFALLGSTPANQVSGDVGYDAGFTTGKKMDVLASDAITGKIRFTGTNTVGKKVEVVFYSVSFGSGSSLNLISDEWGEIELTAEVLYDETEAKFGEVFELN